jgi:hypothetical protein
MEGRRERNIRLTGPRNDDELEQTGQFSGLAPFGQMSDIVCSEQVKDLGVWKSAAIIARGIDGVRDAAALDFLLVDFSQGFAGERQSQEAQAFVGRGGLAVRFERGLGSRNEEEPRQVEFFAGSLSDEQVTHVNRVKRTAE